MTTKQLQQLLKDNSDFYRIKNRKNQIYVMLLIHDRDYRNDIIPNQWEFAGDKYFDDMKEAIEFIKAHILYTINN